MDSLPIIEKIPVQWADLDALGHVNHARIITWMESARMALFLSIGLEAVGQPEQGPILAHLSVDYLAPVHYPGAVLSCTGIERIGRTSFTMVYRVHDAAESTRLIARGSTVIVMYDYEQQSKIVIPDGVRASLEALAST
ncbi:MAG: thioesterase family protein [Myxococcota bacterium]|nr:thioesterase family protein [Myxococcota bacterium]